MADPISADLYQFKRDLRKVDRRLPKYIGKAHKAISKEVGLAARSAMGGSRFPALRSHAARGVRWSGTQREASVVLKAGTGAIAQERGTKYHRLWGRRVLASKMRRRVFPAWRGNKWEAGAGSNFGAGGYIVAPLVERRLPMIEEHYLDYIDDALSEAFPN